MANRTDTEEKFKNFDGTQGKLKNFVAPREAIQIFMAHRELAHLLSSVSVGSHFIRLWKQPGQDTVIAIN